MSNRMIKLSNYKGEIEEVIIEDFENVFMVLLTINAGDDEIMIIRENGDIESEFSPSCGRWGDAVDVSNYDIYNKPKNIDLIDDFNKYPNSHQDLAYMSVEGFENWIKEIGKEDED